MAEEYNIELQKLYLEFLVSDHELFVRCNSILDEVYFDRGIRDSVQFVREYANEYGSVPERMQIKAKTGLDIQDIGKAGEEHRKWFLDDFERFCRHKALERAILASTDKLEKKEYGAVEELIKNAVQIGLAKELGTNYWEDPTARLQRIMDKKGGTSTGWTTVDHHLYGGFNRGELNIFAGGSGAGKSLFLQNLALNWVEKGYNVLYVSLELSEDLCGMRLDSMLTGYSTKQLFKNKTDVALKISMKAKKSGKLQLVQLPNGINVNDLKAYIKEYQIQNNLKVDCVLLDYLDLMNPAKVKISSDNISQKDKHVSEELRNFAMEGDYLFATASQLNRCISLESKVIVNGKNIRIADVNEGDWIESNEGPVKVTHKYPITTQSVYRIKTKSGRMIECSANHKIPTEDGLKTINSGLQVGDKLRAVINTTATQDNTDEKHNPDNAP
jgi:replicative DNA helicase